MASSSERDELRAPTVQVFPAAGARLGQAAWSCAAIPGCKARLCRSIWKRSGRCVTAASDADHPPPHCSALPRAAAARMPAVGLGTWTQHGLGEVSESVEAAIR